MSAVPDRSDVIVIGGGIIGCTIAWRLAQRGRQVTVLDRAEPGRGATWAAAGWLSVYGEHAHHFAFNSLASRSRAAYPLFVEEIGAASGMEIEFGVPGKRDVSHQPPLWHENDAFVDNRQLGAAAAIAAARAGAVVIPHTPVARVIIEENRVTGVELLRDRRTIECATVVIAAGAWSADIAGLPRRLPVQPVKGQMISLRTERPLQHILVSKECYLIPRSENRVLVGATIEHVGFTEGTTEQALRELRAAANRIVPALGEAELLEQWYGFRPGTPDDLPILGADSTVSGLVYATGHYRNGILLAPITAEIITSLISDGVQDPVFTDFGIARFA